MTGGGRSSTTPEAFGSVLDRDSLSTTAVSVVGDCSPLRHLNHSHDAPKWVCVA
jgi:hypothetical protein